MTPRAARAWVGTVAGADPVDAGPAGRRVPVPGSGTRSAEWTICPTRSLPTRCGSAPAVPIVAVTAAVCPAAWSGSQPPFGFCDDEVEPWLPQLPQFAGFTVESQRRDPTSTWNRPGGGWGAQALIGGLCGGATRAGRVHFQRPTGTGTIDVLMNLGDTSIALPPEDPGPPDPKPPDGALPPDAAVWWGGLIRAVRPDTAGW